MARTDRAVPVPPTAAAWRRQPDARATAVGAAAEAALLALFWYSWSWANIHAGTGLWLAVPALLAQLPGAAVASLLLPVLDKLPRGAEPAFLVVVAAVNGPLLYAAARRYLPGGLGGRRPAGAA